MEKGSSGSLVVICLFLLSFTGFSSSSPVLDFCPEGCDCAHSRHLACANRGLRTVPKTAAEPSDDALIFSLGGNFITNISASDFSRYSRLVRLNLQYNQIAIIHPKAFEKLSRLEELYLGHNLLTALPAGSLQHLKKLSTFYGNNNHIKKITPDNFLNLDKLVKLRLDGNSLEVLPDSVFKGLTSLQYLHLEHNKVQHIHRNAFSKLTNLRFLNLAHNKQSALTSVLTFSPLRALTTLLLSENEIQHAGNHIFQNLKKLAKLSLSNNRISHMDRDALKGLSSLREFLIDGNELEEINAGWLDPLKRVEVLDLSHNRISSVDSLAFSKLKYLKVLRLKNNFLTSLSGEIFAFNNVLQDIDLHGNNWTCDCRLEDLKKWMTSAHSQSRLLTVFVQCHYPEILRGVYLDYVNSSQLQPGWNHSCKSGAGPAESQGGGPQKKFDRKGEKLDGERRGKEDQMELGERNKTELEEREVSRNFKRGGIMMREEREGKKKSGQKEAEIQGDQGSLEAEEPSILKEKKTKKESRSAAEAGKRPRDRHRSNVIPRMDSLVTSKPSHPANTNTSSVVQSGEKFDLLRSDSERALPVISDPCFFNRHFITNVSVDQVTSSTVTVSWMSRNHHRYTPGPKPGLHEVHYRILFDRFGVPERFPRYVYAKSDSRSVTLRELTSGVTYVVCVEGVVGGSVCQVAPRDHCVGVVTLPEENSQHGSASLTSDLQLVTVVTLVGNAILLLAISGLWLGRRLRRRLRRRKSAVHVRHMYSTRRPFRPTAAAASASTDFTSFQSSRAARLSPLEEGDLIEFPCDRFLDNCGVRRDSDMQRFSD
ncbi:PREDICTED: TLR4 interactor with leucine rich repeats [Cyprinodon variegatus]|uniref:TLR4 interactor with leucine rich repeats n=1 Tax=Cyprinodon variegatus TaxID=28743 RepID=UPI00074299CB|nr:PREDICTED: TLR4 interactor with leucine rich repeats [Cyprinodon variegatus]